MAKIRNVVFTLFLVSLAVIPALVQAQNTAVGGSGQSDAAASGNVIKLNNPLSVDTPQLLIGLVINSVLGVVGSLALLMFIYGGLTWMTSAGSQEKVKKGRDIILWSAIGLVVIFTAYAMTRFVLSTIVQ
jgi:hypothetical protein